MSQLDANLRSASPVAGPRQRLDDDLVGVEHAGAAGHRQGVFGAVAGRWLTISLLTGAGIGLTLPVQSVAAVASPPPARLALGSAVAASFRQLGAVLGVSIFVAILATSAPAHAVTAYHRAWWVFAALSVASGAVVVIPRLRRST